MLAQIKNQKSMYKHRKNTLTQHQSNARNYVKKETKQIKTKTKTKQIKLLVNKVPLHLNWPNSYGTSVT